MSKNWVPSIKKPKNKTILELAQNYRQTNPKKWEERQEEIREEIHEQEQDEKKDCYLEEYYEEMLEIKKEEDTIAQRPASLQLQLEYFPNKKSRKQNKKKRKMNRKNIMNLLTERETIVRKGDLEGCCGKFVKGKETDSPELKITIFEGLQLNNALATGVSILRQCQIKIHIFSNENEKPRKLKTKFELCTLDGNSKWYYRFRLRGFTEEELLTHHILFEVIGKNRHKEKLCIGHVLLANVQAKISLDEASSPRAPTNDETKFWKSAVEKPCTEIDANIKIRRFVKEGFGPTIAAMLSNEDKQQNIIGIKAK